MSVPIADKNVKPHVLLVQIQNGISTLVDNLVSYKAKYSLTMILSTVLDIYPTDLKTQMHAHVYINCIYNYQNTESTKMSFNR